MFCARHTAINPVGHMSDLCSLHFGAKDIKLQRTKCTSIIKYVLAPHFDEELRKDIGDSKFSLLIDESTDISINKVLGKKHLLHLINVSYLFYILGVAIVFYSNQRLDITSTLLSLIQIESGDAITIANCVVAELNKRKIPIKNMVGIGTDNANVMVGKNKSVFVELKKSVPSLILIKRVCHSVQFSVNAATIISETYAWFSKSSSDRSLIECCSRL